MAQNNEYKTYVFLLDKRFDCQTSEGHLQGPTLPKVSHDLRQTFLLFFMKPNVYIRTSKGFLVNTKRCTAKANVITQKNCMPNNMSINNKMK